MQAGLEGRMQIILNPTTPSVSVQVQRPLAAIQQLLLGNRVEQVLERIPLLFSVCSQAQSLAALRACQAALQLLIQPELDKAQQQLVNLETQREHVVQILRDWSTRLGQQPNPSLIQQAMRLVPQARQTWFKEGKAFALTSELMRTDTDIFANWDAFLETHLFAMSLDEWSRLNTLRSLQAWIDAQATLPAQTLAALQQQQLASLGANHFPLAQEASVLKRQAQQPLIQAALARYGNGVFTRYLARLLELVQAPSWQPSWVEAARGALQHQLELNAEGRIANYRILAPTEVNFAPDGSAVAGLKVLLASAKTPEQLEQQARLWVAAIDPCVAYDLELQYA